MAADIESLTWMSPATKKEALVKLHGVMNKIGYPDKWRDYSSLEILPGDFVGNAERAAAFEERRELSRIGKPVDRSEWDMTSAYCGCLLRSADEPDQFSGWCAAAAAVRSENGCRAQLWQYGSDDRS
jgi:hypothetical protein